MIQPSHNAQGYLAISNIKLDLYDKAYQLSKNNHLMRLSGPFIAVAYACLTVSSRIVLVVETVFKGFANIILFPFITDYKALQGIKQLFVYLPLSVLFLLISPIYIGVDAPITTLAMLTIPEGYSELRRFWYIKNIDANKTRFGINDQEEHL